ncbi:hypothetical protein ACFOG5_09955 [Pedobacter fastidiosus]|uniref:Lanthionine synthetase C-like protein n=1 Tax=Pedobacter fastidiosus TaxID=2765361 RepID=A0ABR7KWE2_9SPHI|nr:hypothetical protein [Pedobacter fastidiosus]MBC6112439.1 hypothetical protein [Pedobacter fastidiosus]
MLKEREDYITELNSLGLLDGKMGICIATFLMAVERSDEVLKEKAQDLLNHIAEQIADIESLNYADGLAGIGYGIEWLSQNNYIDINSDEVLSDIDDELYKAVVYTRSANATLAEGILGKALFFYKRLQAKNPNVNRYTTICLNECLVLLSDELLDYFLDEETGVFKREISNLDEDEILLLSQSLIFFQKLYSIHINTDTAEKGICQITGFLERIFEEKSLFTKKNFIYLVHAYTNVAVKLKDSPWLATAKSIYIEWSNTQNDFSFNVFTSYMHITLCKEFNINYTIDFPNNSNLTGLCLSSSQQDSYAKIWLLN